MDLKKPAAITAAYGILAALAIVLGWVEAQIPAFFAVPGMKIGLTNVAVLIALYCIDSKSALIINIVRIIISGLLFGTGVSLMFSLAGGFLSTLVMIGLKKTGRFKIVTVSICGGVTHNTAQVLVAMLLLSTPSLAWYMLILWFAGIAAGAAIGLIGALAAGRLKKIMVRRIS